MTVTVDRQLVTDHGKIRDETGALNFGPTKTGTKRVLVAGRALASILEPRMETPGEGGVVFTNRNGDAISPNSLRQRAWDRACNAVLGRRVHLHSLRHSLVDWLREVKVDPRTIADYVGHSTRSSMTMGTYASDLHSLKVEAGRLLDGLVAPWFGIEAETEIEPMSAAAVLAGLDAATIAEPRDLLAGPRLAVA
jgi:integrase